MTSNGAVTVNNQLVLGGGGVEDIKVPVQCLPGGTDQNTMQRHRVTLPRARLQQPVAMCRAADQCSCAAACLILSQY